MSLCFKTVDLFCGIGGMRLGFERACSRLGFDHQCVFSSDINKNACKVYRHRFGNYPDPFCDITKVDETRLSDCDVLLAGFPCQAFSYAGAQKGFEDTRGTLFFDVARILKHKQPKAFILENVRGLVSHDKGKTLKTIIQALYRIGYDNVSYGLLNSKDFGVPQNRPRVYIVGFRNDISTAEFQFPVGLNSNMRIGDILQTSPPEEREYISKKYWNTLVRHKLHHQSKGQGFGYEIKRLDDIANTIMCGGMGRERNLLIDSSDRILPEWVNDQRVRTMTPVEWERLQGFHDGWTEIAPHTARMTLLGNSVTVNVIESISLRVIRTIMEPSKYVDKGDK